ncbi:hypothetical protein B0H15DRAFT_803256 [Mycena belliarum]|uniref:Uncharacterized protein n=1 Tax=Mycena belliarum TaxID=1033014 RepID=A0AAD6U2D9_9AGAR|nr:hypothetical protein B0H15DRAFT_803256 [Mycena belliae]
MSIRITGLGDVKEQALTFTGPRAEASWWLVCKSSDRTAGPPDRRVCDDADFAEVGRAASTVTRHAPLVEVKKPRIGSKGFCETESDHFRQKSAARFSLGVQASRPHARLTKPPPESSGSIKIAGDTEDGDIPQAGPADLPTVRTAAETYLAPRAGAEARYEYIREVWDSASHQLWDSLTASSEINGSISAFRAEWHISTDPAAFGDARKLMTVDQLAGGKATGTF